MFTDLFGGSPHARVFDFLASASDRDHTIMEMARGSGVARPTVYKIVDDFLEKGLVVETRTIGNSRFFQIDREDQTVQNLMRVFRPAEFADFGVNVEPARRRPGGRASRQR